MGYEENTTKQFRNYAPDLGHFIRASIVKFDESVRGGDMELSLPVMTGSADSTKKKRSRGRSTIKFIEYKGPESQTPFFLVRRVRHENRLRHEE